MLFLNCFPDILYEVINQRHDYSIPVPTISPICLKLVALLQIPGQGWVINCVNALSKQCNFFFHYFTYFSNPDYLLKVSLDLTITSGDDCTPFLLPELLSDILYMFAFLLELRVVIMIIPPTVLGSIMHRGFPSLLFCIHFPPFSAHSGFWLLFPQVC